MSKEKETWCTPYNPTDDTQFELKLVSYHIVPSTGEREEGIVWRFGISASQIHKLKISYPL